MTDLRMYSGRILSGYRHDLVITYRTTKLGHVLAIGVGAVLAAIAVFGFGA